MTKSCWGPHLHCHQLESADVVVVAGVVAAVVDDALGDFGPSSY